jgi:hypothetical protein
MSMLLLSFCSRYSLFEDANTGLCVVFRIHFVVVKIRFIAVGAVIYSLKRTVSCYCVDSYNSVVVNWFAAAEVPQLP